MSGARGAGSERRRRARRAAVARNMVMPCGHKGGNASVRYVGLVRFEACGVCHVEHTFVLATQKYVS